MDEMNFTTAEMLEQVNKAIYSICVTGQSYKIGTRQVTRADLNTLYTMKKELQAELAATNNGLLDDCYVAIFDRR